MAQALPVIGYVVGSFFGAPQLGALIGSALSIALAPDVEGPGAGDLTAPKLQLGSQLPRVYGRVRLPVNPIAISDFRATEHEAGGGKGPDGPSSFTYSIDMLGAICDGTNVVAITRQWFNKKLIYTALSDSSPASLANSQLTDYYSSMQLLTGGPSQMPAPLYEDRVGAENAPAYRNICTVEYGDIQCGGGKQPPMIEVEIVTAAEVSEQSITAEVFATWVETPGIFGIEHQFFSFTPSSTEPEYSFKWSGDAGRAVTRPDAFSPDDPLPENCHFAIVLTPTERRIYFNGILEVTQPYSGYTPDETGMVVTIGDPDGYTSGVTNFTVNGFRISRGALFGNSSFTPPTSFPDPTADTLLQCRFEDAVATDETTGIVPDQDGGVLIDGGFLVNINNTASPNAPSLLTYEAPTVGVAYTPQTVTLASIISAELLLNPEVSASDFDVTDLEEIEVIGYTAIGPPARTIAELCDIHYVDIVPGNPYRFQRRGGASVVTIPYEDTGAGVDQPGEPFTGMKRGNADETAAIAAVTFPLIDRDHEAGHERGDRLATDTDDVRRIQTRVVMTAAMGKGRAITSTLLDRVRRHTANYGLSDKYAALEPGDVVTGTDNDGNTYRKRLTRLSYSDGVKACEWELDDNTALVEEGVTDTDYTPSIEIVPPGIAEWQAMDLPQLRDADSGPGYYLASKTSDDSRAYAYESPDDTTYTEVQRFDRDAVFGDITSITGALTASGFFDEYSTIRVDVGDGTLASSTRDAILANRAVNAFAIVSSAGACRVVGQFRDADVVSSGVYDLSGILLDRWEDARYVGDVAAGDVFCLLTTSGIARLPRSLAQLGVQHYVKNVPERRSAASIDGVAFTAEGVSLKPLSPVQLRISRDASTGDITGTFNRTTRLETRFGGDLGDACPLGEDSEQYRVRMYTDGTFATVVRDLGIVTSASFSYTGAQRTTDYGSSTATAYVDIRQLSASVGEGYPLQTTA